MPLAVAAALLAAAGLTACSDVRDEDVTLAGVRDAVVVSGGSERAAAEGAKLGKGDRVRTGASGSATLVVRDRRVLLAPSTEVVVPDGASVDLARGALLVDHRDGPGVTVRAGDTTVDDIGDGAVRVERRLSVVVSALSAGSRVRTASGQRLSMDPLYQVSVAGRALPREAAPLQLRHDAWERDVVATLLADDTRLNALAAGLDRPAAILPASFPRTPGVRPSDTLLADAIDRAAGEQGRALSLRTRGGSWGVVAALLDTSAVEVGTALSAVLRGVPAPSASSSPRPVVAGESPRGDVTRPRPSSSPAPSPTRSSGGGPRPTPKPTTSPKPTSSPSPTDSLEDVIGQIIPTPSIGLPLLP
ncbi:MAG TPA: hypothetical protein VGX28_00585 [Frankiaceae bacterium]|nr:hypothetical protein [Frankiaceae bacterium]